MFSIYEIKNIKFYKIFLITQKFFSYLAFFLRLNNHVHSSFLFYNLNMIKLILAQTNKLLTRYNQSSTPSLWMFLHKWNYEHTFTKNFLQFSNRILRGINKYHVFRWDWMVGVLGAFFGIFVIELEQLYYQIKIGYKPTTSDLVIKGVLKNLAVSNKLKQALDLNVFRNQDIQYYVHQALLNQVLNPQKQTIKSLILSSVREISRNDQSLSQLSGLLAQNINVIKQPLKGAALSFLQSETMNKIAANGIKSLLESLFLKQFIANQINDSIKSSLKDQKNSQYLYQIVKQKISF